MLSVQNGAVQNAESDPIDDYHNTGVNTAMKLCEVQLLELFCKVR